MGSAGSLILVVDDEPHVAEAHFIMLRKLGFDAELETDPAHVEQHLESRNISLVLLDMRLGNINGLDILKRIKSNYPHVGVLMATVVNEIELAVQAIKNGAYNYLLKPLSEERLQMAISSYFANQARPLGDDARFSSFITGHEPMREIFHRIAAFSNSDVPILIEGETGTGKELVAQLVHSLSPRSGRQLLCINSAAVPNDLFEAEFFGHSRGAFTGAQGERIGYFQSVGAGTLFLDEIGELGLENQKKLLRVLQDRRYQRLGESNTRMLEARLVFATNREISDLVQSDSFRSDLFYRIGGHTITMPALRDRGDDVVLLARYFLRKYCSQHGRQINDFSEQALNALSNYIFPGNVRELEGIISAAVLLERSHQIELSTLPEYLFKNDLNVSVNDLGQLRAQTMMRVLHECNGNQSKAAQRLGISRETINRNLRKYRQQSQVG